MITMTKITHLNILGSGKHLVEAEEGLVSQVNAGVPCMLLGEFWNVFQLAQNLCLGSITCDAVDSRHHSLLDHLQNWFEKFTE